MKKAALVSLGCAKNLVDSEIMAASLRARGYAMTENPAEAALIVVNTCGFLESAVSEALETALDLARLKETGACETLVVAGCMVQRYGKKLLGLIPEADLFVGTSHALDLGQILKGREEGAGARLHMGPPRSLMSAQTPRARATPPHTAWLKIAEGCSNRCAFCVIPSLRGPMRSRPREDVLAEARRLAKEGVVEVNLISQDTTAYGTDRGEKDALARLLEDLGAVPGLRWVRVLYAHPGRVTPRLLSVMANSPVVVPYLDVPFQHAAPAVLARMHRGEEIPDPRRVVEAIRRALPGAALRTSLMTGFPGETERDFSALREFVSWARFEHLGVFAFSPEAGSRAARLPNPVPEAVKEARRDEIMALQRAISRKALRRLIGRALPVLIEGPHPETPLLLSGRLPTQAPEVDGSVMVTAGEAAPGAIVSVRVTASHDYDLEGEIEDGPPGE